MPASYLFKLRTHAALYLSLLTALSGHPFPAAAQTPLPAARFHLSHAAMGTEFTIDLYAHDEPTAEAEANLAFDEIDRLEELLSNYKPSSELSRISREAAGGPVTTDPETFQFLQRALYWSAQSGGAFDITVGPLLKAWGLYQHGGRIPTEPELEAIKKDLGWEKIALDQDHNTVTFKTHRPMDLDPGSIGKGFAVDSAARLLRESGVQSALISAGGSTLYAIGSPPGESGWPVVVNDPRHQDLLATTIFLKDTSLSSGACTQKFFIKDGHRYCHIFNPRTMRPVEGVLQTTVISASATDSDALSTVVFVLSPEASRRVIESVAHAEALIFTGPAAGNDCIAIHWQGNPCSTKDQPQQKEMEP